jgi:hypothetical protein
MELTDPETGWLKQDMHLHPLFCQLVELVKQGHAPIHGFFVISGQLYQLDFRAVDSLTPPPAT